MPAKRPMSKELQMSARELDDALGALGLTQVAGADFLGVDDRTMRRWVADGGIPLMGAKLLRLMVKRRIKPKKVQ